MVPHWSEAWGAEGLMVHMSGHRGGPRVGPVALNQRALRPMSTCNSSFSSRSGSNNKGSLLHGITSWVKYFQLPSIMIIREPPRNLCYKSLWASSNGLRPWLSPGVPGLHWHGVEPCPRG